MQQDERRKRERESDIAIVTGLTFGLTMADMVMGQARTASQLGRSLAFNAVGCTLGLLGFHAAKSILFPENKEEHKPAAREGGYVTAFRQEDGSWVETMKRNSSEQRGPDW